MKGSRGLKLRLMGYVLEGQKRGSGEQELDGNR